MASRESARSGGGGAGGASSTADDAAPCEQGTPGCCSASWTREQWRGSVCDLCAQQVDGLLDPDQWSDGYMRNSTRPLYEGSVEDAIFCALHRAGFTPISHTDDGQVVQDIGKRRDRLDAHAWASSQLVELVFDESDIADASSDKKHPPQGWTNSDPQGRQRLYSKAYWVHMLSAITSFAWSNREQPKGAEIKPWLDYAWSMSVSAAFCSHMSAVYHPSLGLGVWGYGVGWCPPLGWAGVWG